MDFSKYAEMLQIAGAVALGLPALISALIGFFMIIPGAEPEATLQKILDKMKSVLELIAKFSRK